MTEAKGQRSQTRGPDRNRVLWAATVLTPDGAHQVRVRDLSNTGAHVLAERIQPGIRSEVHAVVRQLRYIVTTHAPPMPTLCCSATRAPSTWR